MTDFAGFSGETVSFLNELTMHNDKTWFEENRRRYEESVLVPARAFITDMGSKLAPLARGLHADPRVNKSLFKIHRDIRFSKDKRPFKTHLGIWLWEGEGKRMDCPGFYFHLEPPRLMLGGGMHAFNREMLALFRDAVVDKKRGPALALAVEQAAAAGLSIGVKHYKRAPRGYDPGHINAAFLLHSGLTAWKEYKIPQELYSKKLLDFCLQGFEKMLPIHRWLLDLTRSAA